MSNEKPRGGNGSVPGTRRKTGPLARASGPAEYTAGQDELEKLKNYITSYLTKRNVMVVK